MLLKPSALNHSEKTKTFNQPDKQDMKSSADILKMAITAVYQAFPNLSYRPRPDDVKLLAAYMKSQDNDYPGFLDTLLEVENGHIELALTKYHNINKTSNSQKTKASPALDRSNVSF